MIQKQGLSQTMGHQMQAQGWGHQTWELQQRQPQIHRRQWAGPALEPHRQKAQRQGQRGGLLAAAAAAPAVGRTERPHHQSPPPRKRCRSWRRKAPPLHRTAPMEHRQEAQRRRAGLRPWAWPCRRAPAAPEGGQAWRQTAGLLPLRPPWRERLPRGLGSTHALGVLQQVPRAQVQCWQLGPLLQAGAARTVLSIRKLPLLDY